MFRNNIFIILLQFFVSDVLLLGFTGSISIKLHLSQKLWGIFLSHSVWDFRQLAESTIVSELKKMSNFSSFGKGLAQHGTTNLSQQM